MRTYPKFKVAAMHASPVFLDTKKTVDKACSLIEEAADHGASLVVFPEAFVPCFPIWHSLRAPGLNHEYFHRLAAAAVHVPGAETRRLAELAKRRDVVISIGINEGTVASIGCVWNTNILIGSDGRLLNHHRKIVPTYMEKLTWANGDGAGLRIVDTALGRIGALICAENCNPLARHALMAQGEQLHIATYPSTWLNGGGMSLAEGVRIRTEAHCTEAKVFTVAASMFLTEKAKEILAEGDVKLREKLDAAERNPTMIMGPSGELKGPVLREEEGILYADIDIDDCIVQKQFHDLAGYMNRFDIFNLSVDRSTNDPVTFVPPRGGREFVDMDLTADTAGSWSRSPQAAE
jgi:aliphatic nitrilase